MQNLRNREVACNRDNSFPIRLALLLTVTVSGLLFYHFSTDLSRAQNPTPATTAAETDHYLYAAVYSMREGQKSTLVLNNALNRPISARVTLYNKHGQALAVPEINLSSNGNRYFNVADWLSTADIEDFSEGSLEVFFHGPSMGIGAQLVVADQDHGLSFDVFLTEDMDFDSARLESLWWSLDDKTQAQVFLANTKLSRLIVTPTFYVRGVGIESEPIILDSHESETLDIRQALNKLKLKQNTATGGMSLRHNGPPGSLAAVGVVTNKQRGFSSTLRFADPLMQRSTILHGAHLLIGHPPPQSGMPHGASFVPRIIVRNTTDSPVDLKGRVRYTADNSSATVEIDPVTLRSNEVRDLDLSRVITSIGANTITDAGIEIEHSGQPGSIVASAASIDATGNLVFDVPIKDPRAKMTMAGGNYPWRIDGENRAVLHLKNIDPITETRARTAVVVIYYDGGSYSLPLQSVEAGQTFEVDIKRLRDRQIKDSFGRVIPLNVSTGQLVWYGRGPLGQFTGRLVQYNAKAGTSSSFSCPLPCDCEPTYASGRIDPSSIQGVPGDVYFITLIEVDRDCNGFVYEFQVGDPSAFVSSTNPFVASVAGPTTDPFGNTVWQVTLGDQGGTATINASWSAVHNFATCIGPSFGGHCSEFRCDSSSTTGSAGSTAKTQVPTSLGMTIGSLRTHSGTAITDCVGNTVASVAYGYSRLIIYTVLDQNGKAI